MKKLQASKSTETKHNFFSTSIQTHTCRKISKPSQGWRSLPIMTSTSVYHHLWGKQKKQSFSYIWERIWHKMQGWKEKLLLQGGRQVLIKSVLQAMPTFTMGCFKILKSLCKDIEALIRKFWWGYKGDKRKTHWVGWKKLCKSKGQGGLGFKDIETFNLAMLDKQVWRLLRSKDSFFYKVFKSKYFPDCTILEEGVKLNGSYAWQSILKARRVVWLGSK